MWLDLVAASGVQGAKQSLLGLSNICEAQLAVFLNTRGMYLPIDKAEPILKMLVDGSGISAIERISGVHHGTILKLLDLAGERCERIMGKHVRNVK